MLHGVKLQKQKIRMDTGRSDG